jgi:mono/diheme cytochrome c family protein
MEDQIRNVFSGGTIPRKSVGVLYVVLYAILLSLICVSATKSAPTVDETLPLNYMPSGAVMYKQYCATCHGAQAKGDGPLGSFLKVPPPDLTKLAQRHAGQFPYEYVTKILEFGPGATAHGSSDMPTWGPIFEYFDKQNQKAVQKRIKNLCDYLATLQEH